MHITLVLFVLGFIPRLWARELQRPLKTSPEIFPTERPQIIVGVRGVESGWPWPWHGPEIYPKVRVIDIPSEETVWEWSPSVGLDNLPFWVAGCVKDGISVNEVKWAANGTRVAAIVNNAAVVINYAPGTPADKKVIFAACKPGSHSLEILPNNLLAVATSGPTQEDGIEIYDIGHTYLTRMADSPYHSQKISGFPAVHGLLWDENEQKLWAVGNDEAPERSEGKSTGILRAYPLNSIRSHGEYLDVENGVETYEVAPPAKLDIEWPCSSSCWWDGPHDLTGSPGGRFMHITSDLGLHTFDAQTRKFIAGSPVQRQLQAFKPNGDRTGSGGKELPWSDIKAFGVHRGQILYIQADWKGYYTNAVSHIARGRLDHIPMERQVYKARWFAETPGWRSAS